MKPLSYLAFAALSVFLVTPVQADEGPTCPVSGRPAKDVAGSSVEHNGGTVLFCCARCPNAFKANTEKYAAKANAQLVSTGQVEQGACPITGRDLNPAQKLTIAGIEINFCCPGCKGKVSKLEGDAQLNAVLSDKAFKKAKFAPADDES